MPATCESLRLRHDAIAHQFHDNEQVVRDIQQQAIDDVLPAVESDLEPGEEAVAAARAFLQDRVTVFRFCRRARFNPPAALKLLHATLTFRFSPASTFSSLSPSTISPLYLNDPLFFFHPDLRDRFGRPCAVLNLRYVRRTDDGELGNMKDFIRLGWEVSRRWLSDLSKQSGEPKLQIVVIVDLEGAGMSNLEVELLPFFMDLLKSHFPGMVGAIFVLNYGWMYAGMWQLAKRVLPNTALERILFPSKEQLLEFFEEDHLLVEHGGKVEYTYTPSNPILAKYGSPLLTTTSAYPSPSPSPSHSSASLHSEIFHSAPSSRSTTPATSVAGGSVKWHTGLNMTPTTPGPAPPPPPTARSPIAAAAFAVARNSPIGLGFMLNGWRGTPRPEKEGGGVAHRDPPGSTLKRVTSLAELQERLAETQKAIESDDSDMEEEMMTEGLAAPEEMMPGQSEDGEGSTMDEDDDGASGTGTDSRGYSSVGTSARSSRYSSRATSRNVSRTTSREGSPARGLRMMSGMTPADGETFSSRAVKFSGLRHLSPYNHSNPYYGYPAFVPSSSQDPTGIPRPHYQRRRKRDLARTLTYLAVLRFLALHRQLRLQVAALFKMLLRLAGLSTPAALQTPALPSVLHSVVPTPGEAKHVHWESDDRRADVKLAATTRSVDAQTSQAYGGALASLPLMSEQFWTILTLFILLRTPDLPAKIRQLAIYAIFRLPVKMLTFSTDTTYNTLAYIAKRGRRRERKRDVLRRAVGKGGLKLVQWANQGESGPVVDVVNSAAKTG